VIERVLADGASTGLFAGVSPRVGAEMLIGLVRGVDRSRDDGETSEELAERVLDVFVCGVATATARKLRKRNLNAAERDSR
jgi:hypothetical protein